MTIIANPQPAGKPGGAKLDPPALLAAIAFARRGWLIVPRHAITWQGCTCGRPDCPTPGEHCYFSGWGYGGTRDEALIRQLWGVAEPPFVLGVRGETSARLYRVSGGPDLTPRLVPRFQVWTVDGVVSVYTLPIRGEAVFV